MALSPADDVGHVSAVHKLEFELYGRLRTSDHKALGLTGTPHTMVVSPDGRVRRAWLGAYNRRIQREMESYFGVRLPGLSNRTDGAARGSESFRSAPRQLTDGGVGTSDPNAGAWAPHR